MQTHNNSKKHTGARLLDAYGDDHTGQNADASDDDEGNAIRGEAARRAALHMHRHETPIKDRCAAVMEVACTCGASQQVTHHGRSHGGR